MPPPNPVRCAARSGILATAVRIVTHNVRDFEGVEARFGIRVVTPGEFLMEVREKA